MQKTLFILFTFLMFGQLQSQVKIDGDEVTVLLPSSSFDKNIIRFNYFRASINGNSVVSYERLIAKFLSVEVGGGITYRTFVDGIFLSLFNLDYPSIADTRYKIGYSAMGGVRFYLKDEYMEGWYLNPFYRVVNYNLTEDAYYNSSKYTIRYNDLSLNSGYNHFLGSAHFDYYWGIGMRHVFIYQERSGTGFNGPSKITQNKVVPIFLIGTRIGLSF